MTDPELRKAISDDGVGVAIGDIVAGKYRVERVLGVGGMGYVVAAKHLQLGEYFALKFLHEEFLLRKGVPERFTREAQAACKIKSENVARVYDVGSSNGVPFLVMEHLVGRDLSTVLSEKGPFSVDDAVEYTMQTCAALAAAHAQGVVHRDIKPENLFLVQHEGLPCIKLLDFGISKNALTGLDSGDLAGSKLTGALTLGTPTYMSPEQIRSSASADERSDLWSLGMVLYELLAGRPAFQADSVAEICAAVLEHEPEPLGHFRSDVPPELAAVVEHCLRKDPANRFQNAAELAVALLMFAPPRALAHAERSSSILRVATPRQVRRKPSTPSSFATRHASLAPALTMAPASSPAVALSIEPATARSSEVGLAPRSSPRRIGLWATAAVIVALVATRGLVHRLTVAPSVGVAEAALRPLTARSDRVLGESPALISVPEVTRAPEELPANPVEGSSQPSTPGAVPRLANTAPHTLPSVRRPKVVRPSPGATPPVAPLPSVSAAPPPAVESAASVNSAAPASSRPDLGY